MTSPSEPRTPRLYHAYGAGTAAKLAAGAIATVYLAQLVLALGGVPGLIASGASFVIVAGVLVAVARVSGGRARLGLVRPRARFVVAGLFVGVSCWFPSLMLVSWLLPHGHAGALERITRQPPLVATLVVIALLPAIAEEMLFRGVLARGLATRLGAFWAIVIAAVVFALYHVLPIQMIPTFLLGLALGVIAVRGDSIYPTMLAHVLNNTIAIVLSRSTVPGVTAWIEAHPLAMFFGSIGVLVTGVALAVPRAKGPA